MIDPKQYFYTSKGPRRRSQIYHVKGGSHVRRSKTVPQIRLSKSEAWQTLPERPAAVQEQGGWQSWTDWQDATQNPVSSFSASWQVPPAPQVANGQLIYLFSGLQDAAGQHILQPVLQWGTSPAQGSGNAWGLASFWVGQDTDPMFCSEWVPVAAGTSVTGRMTVAAEENGLFSCTCSFDNFPGTELTAEDLPALVDCVLTLEAYATGPGAPYPDIPGTIFSAIALTTGATSPAVQWAPSGGAVVKPDGSVEVIYPATNIS